MVYLMLHREIADAAIGLKAQDVETNKVIELSKRVCLHCVVCHLLVLLL